MTERFAPPAWLLGLLGLLLAFAYTYGLASAPLKWDEQRRCQVAIEMIRSGDYVVPHLHGETYFNKPPLQNWLIVALSGNDASRVGKLPVRAITLLSLAGIVWLLWRLGVSQERGRTDLLAPVVFLTFGTVLQYGWAGEVDLPFTFFVTAALASFEFGRRRGAPVTQWVLSQAFVAAGVLTKGLAPLFFYPGVLIFCVLRRRHGTFRAGPFLAGLATMLALVGCWLVPFLLRTAGSDAAARWGSEIVSRVDQGAAALFSNLLSYPLLLLGALLPWSLHLFGMFSSRRRAAARDLLADDWRLLAWVALVWAVAVHLPVPGVKARYLMPVMPLAAALFAWLLQDGLARVHPPDRATRRAEWLRWVGCGALAAAWLVVSLSRAQSGLEPRDRWLVGALCLAALAGVAAARRVGWLSGSVAPLLLVGLVFGIGSRGIVDVHAAWRDLPFDRAADDLAELIADDAPVFCPPELNRKIPFEVGRQLGRSVRIRPPLAGPYYRIGPAEELGRTGERRVGDAWIYAVWRSEQGAAHEPPAPPGDERLLRARELYERRPYDWTEARRLGRVHLEGGRFAAAEALFSRALALQPGEPSLLRFRAEALLEQNRLEPAAADLESAMRRTDGLPDRIETVRATFPDTRRRSSLASRLDRWLGRAAEGGAGDDETPDGPTLQTSIRHLLCEVRRLQGDAEGAAAACDPA